MGPQLESRRARSAPDLPDRCGIIARGARAAREIEGVYLDVGGEQGRALGVAGVQEAADLGGSEGGPGGHAVRASAPGVSVWAADRDRVWRRRTDRCVFWW